MIFGYISYIKTLFAMSLFVHNENQRMLWETLNKLPLFHEVFSQNSMSTLRFQDPQIWFKNIIQLFYDNNRFRPLSSADLKELNREVMKYAIENLKSSYNQPASGVAHSDPGSKQQQYPQSQYYVESKQENYNRQFTDLQQVYERMGAKPEPPKAEFAEGLKDDAISNMDELLRKHMEEREQELPKFAPLPTMQALQTLPKAQSSNSLKITEEKITIRVDEVVHDDKKKVSWSQDIKVEENIEKQEARVLELENQIQMLQNEFDAFKRIMMERVQTIERQFNATTQNKMFE
jgi:hypothetical protein